MIDPYYEHGGITIYHADCRDVLDQIGAVDLVLTDPPYGIDGGRGHGNRARGKGAYIMTGWEDTRAYVRDVCVPIIGRCIDSWGRVIVTPGTTNADLYISAYRPADLGCFWQPAAERLAQEVLI